VIKNWFFTANSKFFTNVKSRVYDQNGSQIIEGNFDLNSIIKKGNVSSKIIF
jgi:hypothetical protein